MRRSVLSSPTRAVLAEAVGTATLLMAIVGSGIAAVDLTDDVGLQLVFNAIATVAVLGVLVAVALPISGGSFNPAVTLVDVIRRNVSPRRGGAYVVAQVAGGVLGTVLAHLMFERDAVSWSDADRGGWGRFLGELVATAGLVAAIALVDRAALPLVVPAWILGAYLFTSSTSFANPAVTVGRALHRQLLRHRRRGRPLVHRRPARRCDARTGSRTHPQGGLMTDRPTVLFVCVHNAGRSQIAAGFLTALSDGAVDVRSAGSMPGDQINPVAVEAMAEVGIDIASEQPKVLTDQAVQDSDVVITMGCGDACPFYPGKRYEDWELDDPAGQDLATVRRVRDEIKATRRGAAGVDRVSSAGQWLDEASRTAKATEHDPVTCSIRALTLGRRSHRPSRSTAATYSAEPGEVDAARRPPTAPAPGRAGSRCRSDRNCGRKVTKNSATFGLSAFDRKPCRR